MVMERHHEMQLSIALDRLYLEGATSIRWDHLYHWFKAQRLGKGSYRDIQRRWEELCTITYGHKSAPELTVLQWKDKPTLTLMRKPFSGEGNEPFSDWM
jgi:hypothetical protein